MLQLLWLIPLVPFAGFAVNGLLGARVLPRRAVSLIGCAAVLAAFVISLGAVVELNLIARDPAALDSGAAPRFTQDLYTWMPMGRSETGEELRVDWSYALDPLSAVMLLVVSGVGFLIHVYSIGYMEHEPRPAFARFFAYLNLFMAMMLVLVLGASLPVVFVGWEGVGLCSYLLIGFYYDRMFDEKTKMTCADAGRKAFIVNRIGDVGFILGMLLLFAATGTLDIQGVLGKVGGLGPGVCTLAALFLFVGACGKSAQIPLYVWLPDAMAGPTPVSALIHAAAMTTVAVIGALTALFAASIGLAQTDIKKVLAYSTVSQLGYMMLAAGVGAFSASIFHLMTHAFFKALLFLAAGSVIHALSGEQDMRHMGGLRKLIPWTFGTMTVATIAIAGIPPLAGFFSKDEILWQAYSSKAFSSVVGSELNIILWLLGIITAFMTSFYMFRLWFMTFFGERREAPSSGHDAHADAHGQGGVHESPWSMLAPLVILAVLATIGGWVGIPHALGGSNHFESFMKPVFEHEASAPAAHHTPNPEAPNPAQAGTAEPHGDVDTERALTGVSIVAAFGGFGLAYLFYFKRRELPEQIAAR